MRLFDTRWQAGLLLLGDEPTRGTSLDLRIPAEDGTGFTSPGLHEEYEMLQAEINSNSQVTANVFAFTVTGIAALIGYGVQTTQLARSIGSLRPACPFALVRGIAD
jgi:hypothetical protein